MNQYVRNIRILFTFTILAANTAFAQSLSVDPPNPIFRISAPTASGNIKTGAVMVQFSIMNYSITKALFQLFPAEIKATDEMNTQYPPTSIRIGRKIYRKQEIISMELLPGDSISCQILFAGFKKTTRHIPVLSAKNRVIMSPVFDQESVLNISNLAIYWQ